MIALLLALRRFFLLQGKGSRQENSPKLVEVGQMLGGCRPPPPIRDGASACNFVGVGSGMNIPLTESENEVVFE